MHQFYVITMLRNTYNSLPDIVKAFTPDVNKNPELFNSVTPYQVLSHLITCQKFKNEKCCYRFVKCFDDHTVIIAPLQDSLQ